MLPLAPEQATEPVALVVLDFGCAEAIVWVAKSRPTGSAIAGTTLTSLCRISTSLSPVIRDEAGVDRPTPEHPA